MSKSYKLTNKWRKIDWLPPRHIANYVKNDVYSTSRYIHWAYPDVPCTKKELIKFIAVTKIIPEERSSTYKVWPSRELKTVTWTYYRNAREINEAKKRLEAIQWWNKNPHREADKDDYFYVSYAKNPGHWNHWTYTKRRRAYDRQLIHKIKAGVIEADEAIFYHKKKPVIYYW